MFKYFALALSYTLCFAYQFIIRFNWLLFLSPILHTCTLLVNPHCYSNHCHPKNQYDECEECGLNKWIRMQHCYRCRTCVHKYDHHCILLGLCIGEANQKYYVILLWAQFYSSYEQLASYLQIIDRYIWVDEHGYEHLEWGYICLAWTIIYLLLSIIIVGYLSGYHTYLTIYNDTTFQMKKRSEIPYLSQSNRLGIAHPFDKGIKANLILLFRASSREPIEWEAPVYSYSNQSK